MFSDGMSVKEKTISPFPVLYLFPQLCVEKPDMSVGALASMPFILESELLQAEDEVLYSFSCGSFTEITKYNHFLFIHDYFPSFEGEVLRSTKESK